MEEGQCRKQRFHRREPACSCRLWAERQASLTHTEFYMYPLQGQGVWVRANVAGCPASAIFPKQQCFKEKA